MSKIILLVLLAVVSSSAMSEEYLCAPDKMTGLAFDAEKEKWDCTQFKTDFKYLISPAKNGRNAFSLIKVDDDVPEGYCKNKFIGAGYLFCDVLGGELKFNRKGGRSQMSFTYDY